MSDQKRFREELPEDAPIWARRINQCLIDDGMTQKQLAEKVKVSEGTIAGWLKGTEPKAYGLIALADALNTTTDFILGRADWRKSNPDDIAISNMTGLSDILLSRIRNAYRYNPGILNVFNFVTASTEFACLMETLYNFIVRVNHIDDSEVIKRKNEKFEKQGIINPFMYSIGAADIMTVAMQRNFWAIVELCLAKVSVRIEEVEEAIEVCNNAIPKDEHGVTHRLKQKEAANDGNENK